MTLFIGHVTRVGLGVTVRVTLDSLASERVERAVGSVFGRRGAFRPLDAPWDAVRAGPSGNQPGIHEPALPWVCHLERTARLSRSQTGSAKALVLHAAEAWCSRQPLASRNVRALPLAGIEPHAPTSSQCEWEDTDPHRPVERHRPGERQPGIDHRKKPGLALRHFSISLARLAKTQRRSLHCQGASPRGSIPTRAHPSLHTACAQAGGALVCVPSVFRHATPHHATPEGR